MGKFIIVEDNSRVLAQMYVFLKRRKPEKVIQLIKCDYNHNCPEDGEWDRKQLKEYIHEEGGRNQLDFASSSVREDLEKIDVIKTVEELLMVNTKDYVDLEDILIMDITLFDSLDEQIKNSFTDYASVLYANKLVEQNKILQKNIRFYTKSTIKSDPRVFYQQTGGKWFVPILRPSNFSMPGGEEEREIFAQNILMEEG